VTCAVRGERGKQSGSLQPATAAQVQPTACVGTPARQASAPAPPVAAIVLHQRNASRWDPRLRGHHRAVTDVTASRGRSLTLTCPAKYYGRQHAGRAARCTEGACRRWSAVRPAAPASREGVGRKTTGGQYTRMGICTKPACPTGRWRGRGEPLDKDASRVPADGTQHALPKTARAESNSMPLVGCGGHRGVLFGTLVRSKW